MDGDALADHGESMQCGREIVNLDWIRRLVTASIRQRYLKE